MTLMTQADFAKRLGVGKSAVSNWKKDGLVVFAEGADGKLYVDAERTEARLNARKDPMRGRPRNGEPVPTPELPIDDPADETLIPSARHSLAAARAELVNEDLHGRRMKNAATAGKLVPLVEAERRLSAIGRMIRERLAAEERNVAERLAVTTDVRAIMAILDEAREKSFAALAASIAGGALDEPDEDDAADIDPAGEMAEAA